ncbi:hypothetical protein VKT23_015976 [Stygiomarasmius scandens]|uniref:Uncharacterized protein n=1 Tax=Marasmiellus scandens TaxID=2682957 RepID=A0ABR1IXL3_9AGAR
MKQNARVLESPKALFQTRNTIHLEASETPCQANNGTKHLVDVFCLGETTRLPSRTKDSYKLDLPTSTAKDNDYNLVFIYSEHLTPHPPPFPPPHSKPGYSTFSTSTLPTLVTFATPSAT